MSSVFLNGAVNNVWPTVKADNDNKLPQMIKIRAEEEEEQKIKTWLCGFSMNWQVGLLCLLHSHTLTVVAAFSR